MTFSIKIQNSKTRKSKPCHDANGSPTRIKSRAILRPRPGEEQNGSGDVQISAEKSADLRVTCYTKDTKGTSLLAAIRLKDTRRVVTISTLLKCRGIRKCFYIVPAVFAAVTTESSSHDPE